MLKFDADTARLLENAYQGDDITRRRRANFDALGPAPGDRIADIGCGNGLLTLELARAVGDAGAVVGVDPSAEMRALAEQRCAAFPAARILDGDAAALPLDDAAVDKAVSVQVFEYLDDIPAALAEARRILKPGGRLVIGDIHWDALAWASDDRARMNRILSAYDGHFAERRVPEILPSLLDAAGFEFERATPITFCDTALKPDGLANATMHLIRIYFGQNDAVSQAEAQAWFDEQLARARGGRFFFCSTHVVTTARKR